MQTELCLPSSSLGQFPGMDIALKWVLKKPNAVRQKQEKKKVRDHFQPKASRQPSWERRCVMGIEE